MALVSGISSSIYSWIPTAFTSRLPIPNTVIRKRTFQTTNHLQSEPSSPWTRSSSSTSTNSLDSIATTLLPSGMSTPSMTSESLHTPSVRMLPNTLVDVPIEEQGKVRLTIDRDTAGAGVILATAALKRLDTDHTDTSARGMYIDAVKYMVQGLPENLSDTENNTLDIITTTRVHNSSRREQHSLALPTNSRQTRVSNVIRSSSARLVNTLLSALFSLILLGLPIFALLFSRALEYERRHRLSEKAVQSTRNLASTVSTTLIRASKTRSGAYCLATVLCFVQSLLEGAGDGINRSTIEFETRLPG